MAPQLKAPIGASATITGDFTESDAERIRDGIAIP
jgi:hypothetical protein